MMRKRSWAEINQEIEALDRIERRRSQRHRGKGPYHSPDATIIRMGQLIEERIDASDREREEQSK